MPLIRSTITWSADKVSASLKNHQENHVENLPPQDLSDTTSEHSLSCENKKELAVEQPNDIDGPVQLNENLDIEPQPTSPNSEFLPKRTSPSPPPLTTTQIQQPKQITSNEITHPDAIHRSQSPTLLPPTPTYPPLGQSTITPQNLTTANEDRNRADYYQAKYYESQRLQGQYQGQGQSAQYGDDCGIVSHQEQQQSGGGGRGRGRRGRGRGGGGLIGMLLKH